VAGPYTLDASVFLNSINPAEEGHKTSEAFLELIHASDAALVEPSLVLVEVSGSLARARDDSELGFAFAREVGQLAGLILVPLGEALAYEAARLAVDRRVCGSDAIYGAVARRYNASLVTRDREQADRLRQVVTVLSVEEAVARA
jgi:predicted nucleic acid-binding protein